MKLLRRRLIVGAGGGCAAGVVFALALQLQAMKNVTGLFGTSMGLALAAELVFATVIGAGFGLLFCFQSRGYAALTSSGLLYGLLWWLLGPLTLVPLLMGRTPLWSVAAARTAFPSLIGLLLYGGILGFSFYTLWLLFQRLYPLTATEEHSKEPDHKRVVILGGGFGGMAVARQLEKLFVRDAAIEIVLVSKSNYLLFTPMLAEVSGGSLEAHHISPPLRASLAWAQVIRAEVEAIDPAAKCVELRENFTAASRTLAYDQLVLALGSDTSDRGVPGVETYAYPLRTLQDATRLRNQLITILERADAEQNEQAQRRDLSVVVVGGGYSGVETVAELFDMTRMLLRYYPNIPEDALRFVLIHSHQRILPQIGEELAEYALHKLKGRGIEFFLGVHVQEVSADGVTLEDGTALSAATVVWTAGNRPNPAVASLACEHNHAGAVVTDETLRVEGLTDVWAVGDCAQVPDYYQSGKPCPPTAQHAQREGVQTAKNVAAALRGETAQPFRFRSLGTLVPLGHRTAVAELRGLKFSGLFAWFLWRTIYLAKLPGLEKKLRVALDWTLDLFFTRDIVLTTDSAFIEKSETHERSPKDASLRRIQEKSL